MKPRILLMLVAATAIAPVWAQQEDGDAPDHGVARISLINGSVSVRHGDAGDVSAAAMNAPLLTGDRIMTDSGSRAEVQFDIANMIRLAPMTEVRMGDLEDRHYLVQVASGMIMFRVARDNNAQVELSTPSVSVRPVRPGNYRIVVRPDGTSEISVRSGEAEVFTPRGSETVAAGRTLMARGTAADPEYQFGPDVPNDEWDRWNANRDRDLDRSVSSRYVSPDVYGTEELDGYGNWVYDDPYGWVWAPRVAAGWAPYRMGRWTWVDYYGWTWLSADPWGWAPYHYGRWYWGTRGWLWYPGAIGPRYYWRPALVGFFGWGGGVGVGFGFGNVGWVPLAPHEVFRPWYGRGFAGRTVNNFTIVNNTNITNVYRNARFVGPNGVTSVRAGEFGNGAIHTGNFVRASEADLRGAGAVHGQLPFTPSAGSRRFSDQAGNAPAFSRANENVQFPSRRSPAPSAAGGTAVQSPGNQGGWRRFDPSTSNAGRGFGSPSAPQVQSQAPVDNRGTGGNGWRRFESNPGGNRSPQAFPSQAPQPSARQGFSFPEQSTADRPGQRFSFPQQQSQGQGQFGGGQRPVQINPPIVRERGGSGGGNVNSGTRPNFSGGGGGFGQARPNSGGGARGGGGGNGGGGGRGTGGGNGGGGGHGHGGGRGR